MILDQLVCTPGQSRKFSDLGLFGDSAFVWIGTTVDRRDLFGDGLRHMENYRGPAPTMQELGGWLWYWRCAAKNAQEKWERDQNLHDWNPIGDDAKFLAEMVLQIIEDHKTAHLREVENH